MVEEAERGRKGGGKEKKGKRERKRFIIKLNVGIKETVLFSTAKRIKIKFKKKRGTGS